MLEVLSYGFMQKALLGGAAIALACGLIGPFLVLRRLSLLGDAMAHLTFGVIALGLAVGVAPLWATLAVVPLGAAVIYFLNRRGMLGDANLALVLSLGLGSGILIISLSGGFGVSVFSYFIGSILALSGGDLVAVGVLLAVVAVFIAMFYRQLLFFTFSEELARLRLKRIEVVNLAFYVVVSLVVVLAVRAVGVLLVSGLIVIPTLIALQLARSFKGTLFFASLASFLGVVGGVVASFYIDAAPSGTIVLMLAGCYLVISAVKRLAR